MSQNKNLEIAAGQWVNLVKQHIYFKRDKSRIVKELQKIPGVGPSLANDMFALGIRSVDSLKGQNPEQMFDKLEHIRYSKTDRCVLYVFRCAIYFASHKKHDPEKLKWWYWKDR